MSAARPPLAAEEHGIRVRFDAGLVEAAVLAAIERVALEERRRFRAERDPIYELEPAERREERYAALHASWWLRLGLAGPLFELLAERPSIAPAISACLVVPASRTKDEHADLRAPRATGAGGAGDDRPALVASLCPTSLVDRGRLEAVLRRDLVYVSDMLDPAFGYDPALAVDQTAGPIAGLLRERHRVLWKVTADGRLAAEGRIPPSCADRLIGEMARVFAVPPARLATTFERLFSGPRPSHGELLGLARDPSGLGGRPSGECPLCKMPVPPESLGGELAPSAVRGASADFPDWRPADGMCPHCADFYELRSRSAPHAAPA